jgi:hypothetical protein
MKTIKFICACLLVTSSMFISSCSSDDDGGGGGSAAAGTIRAKVNGSTVTTLEIATFANQFGSIMQIQGNTGGTSSKAFVLNILTFDGVGTYDIRGGETGLGQANVSYVETTVDLSNPTAPDIKTWNAPFEGGEKVGEIKISEVTDTNVKGTFFFTAKNVDDNTTKEITEGSFNIEL